MNPSLTLYTRDECPLCDQAEQMIMALGIEYEKADISTRVDWLESYRDRIPVVRSADDELGWPFTEDQLRRLAGAV